MFVALSFAVYTLLIEYFLCRIFFRKGTCIRILFWSVAVPFVLGIAMLTSMLWAATYKPPEFWHAVGNTLLANNIMGPWMDRFSDWDQTKLWQIILGTPYVFVAQLATYWWVLLTQHFCLPMLVFHLIALQIFYHTSYVVHPGWDANLQRRIGIC